MSVDGLCWLSSAVYNATYMLPEAILTTVLVVILIRVAPQIFDPQNARRKFFAVIFPAGKGLPRRNFFAENPKSC